LTRLLLRIVPYGLFRIRISVALSDLQRFCSSHIGIVSFFVVFHEVKSPFLGGSPSVRACWWSLVVVLHLRIKNPATPDQANPVSCCRSVGLLSTIHELPPAMEETLQQHNLAARPRVSLLIIAAIPLDSRAEESERSDLDLKSLPTSLLGVTARRGLTIFCDGRCHAPELQNRKFVWCWMGGKAAP